MVALLAFNDNCIALLNSHQLHRLCQRLQDACLEGLCHLGPAHSTFLDGSAVQRMRCGHTSYT